ncbi:hypothetical protein BURKHO8Y_540004 [Burkholderia sp. 8Y]|nr:hypothetical protein BURKHO8Y_540004 [Burkholderia sp. 8Y]
MRATIGRHRRRQAHMQPRPGGVETPDCGLGFLYASPTPVSLLIPKWFPLLENGGNHFGVSDRADQDGRAATLTEQVCLLNAIRQNPDNDQREE